MKKDARFVVSLSPWLLLAAVLSIAAGCGPTRKEYAINEALLVDQTRVLENQLYRAHFQIQRLEEENKQLRSRLEAKGEKLDDLPKTAPFDPIPESRVPQVTQNSRPIQATGNNRFAMNRGAGNAGNIQAAPAAQNRVAKTALAPARNQVVKTASAPTQVPTQAPAQRGTSVAGQRANSVKTATRPNAVTPQPLTP